jgi:hypothetical protein
MKVVAVILGLITFAGLIVLAIAGLSGALAALLTLAALVAMIALGSILGGRHTPDRAPMALPGPESASAGSDDTAGDG